MQKPQPPEVYLSAALLEFGHSVSKISTASGIEDMEMLGVAHLRVLRRLFTKHKDATCGVLAAINTRVSELIASDGDSPITKVEDYRAGVLAPAARYTYLNPFGTAFPVSMWIGDEDQYDEIMDRVFADATKDDGSAFFRIDGFAVAFLAHKSAGPVRPKTDTTAYAYANMGDDSAH